MSQESDKSILSSSRRRFLKVVAGGTVYPWLDTLSKAARIDGVGGIRDHVDHIVIIYQENRSFDHYFGTYVSPHGYRVENILNRDQAIDPKFVGLQKNPAGIAYETLPVDTHIPAFDTVSLENKPFHLAPFIPADSNVPYDPEHHFYRMFLQANNGRMDHFVALALKGGHYPIGEQLRNLPSVASPDYRYWMRRLLMEQSSPSGVVLGHYERQDIEQYHRLADEFVLFDHFFQAMSGGSTGNALYLAASRSCRWSQAPKLLHGHLSPPILDKPYDSAGILINDLPPIQGPTVARYDSLKISPPPMEQSYLNIGDLLDQAGVDWAWYQEGWDQVKPWALKTAHGPGDGSAILENTLTYVPHHNPFQYYPRWKDYVRNGHIRDSSSLRTDIESRRLPNVSFLKANSAHNEHPANSAPQTGMNWVMKHLRTLGESALWGKTLVVLTYDEGGGYWDHLAPPRPDEYGCGTRIPAMMIGPYVRQGYVDSQVANTTSILKLIEKRFGLPALTRRDGSAYDLMNGLNFEQKPRKFEL